MEENLARCAWAGDDPLYQAYHDTEWGWPSRDDQHLFEMLILENQQAGLSWITVLRKREHFRAALDGFDATRIARYAERQIESLMQNPKIIRNRLKLKAAVKNARAFLETQAEYGSFANYVWSFVGNQPRQNNFRALSEIPATSAESDAMSRGLRERGFTFVGSTICYAYMQSVGMVNDHLVTCARHRACAKHR